MRAPWVFTIVILSVFVATCNRAETPKTKQEQEKGASAMALTIKSGVFENGATIPKKYTCDSTNVSPPLSWSGAPEGTKSFALICDDPDAPMGTWVHWVLWGLPPDTMALLEGVPAETTLAIGARQGLNSGSRVGYSGPCPPPGKPHRYFFKLYALDAMLTVPANANKAALEKAMKDHILAEAQVMGRYGR
jgi:Raf kinase inhibitor-like YbhB/YbcL family protein